MSKIIKITALIFSAIIVIASGYGLAEYLAPGQWYGFNYYTVLSNAVCFVYFLGAFIYGLQKIKQGSKEIIWMPRANALVAFIITVTFLIYTFLLAPGDISDGKFWNLHNIAVHYIVPIMSIFYWLLFSKKGSIKSWDPLAWLLVPAAYFAYILMRARFIGNIGPLGTPYPYDFINVQKFGWQAVGKNAILIMLGMIMLGYLFYSIDHVVSKIHKK